MAGRGWQIADGGWQTTDGGKRRVDVRLSLLNGRSSFIGQTALLKPTYSQQPSPLPFPGHTHRYHTDIKRGEFAMSRSVMADTMGPMRRSELTPEKYCFGLHIFI